MFSQDDRKHIYILDNNDVVSDVSAYVRDYQQDWTIGPNMARWTFAVPDVRESGLRAWFANKMMAKVAVQHRGSGQWWGYITKMVLDYDGLRLTKDIKNVVTCAKASYITDETESVLERLLEEADGLYLNTSELRTSYLPYWIFNEEAFALYGRRERIVELNNKEDLNPWHVLHPGRYAYSPAYLLAQGELDRGSSPFVDQIVMTDDADTRKITIEASGAHILANEIILGSARFENAGWGEESEAHGHTGLRTVGFGSAFNINNKGNGKIQRRSDFIYEENDEGEIITNHTISDEVRRIADALIYATSRFGRKSLISIGHISTENKVPIAPGVESEIGAMDRLIELAKIPDLDGNHYELRIDGWQNAIYYQKLDQTPRYMLYPPPRGLEDLSKRRPTWDAKPGPVKIIDPIYGTGLPNTYLGDGSIIYPERVSMRDGQEAAIFGPAQYNASDIRAAIEANQREIDRRMEARRESEE